MAAAAKMGSRLAVLAVLAAVETAVTLTLEQGEPLTRVVVVAVVDTPIMQFPALAAQVAQVSSSSKSPTLTLPHSLAA